jgi:hypothetical protein
MGHLGHRVSALLDGRLDPVEEERAWAHVHACHPCRDLVEREGWVKTRLAGLSGAGRDAPADLKHSLLGGPAVPPGSPRPGGSALVADGFPTAVPTRTLHRGLVAIGGGAAGAAVVGLLALGAAGGGATLDRRAPASELNRSTPTTSLDRSRPAGREETRPPRHVVLREKMEW